MTCIHCDPGVDCAHDRADDVWLTSADLRGGLTPTDRHAGSPETASHTLPGTQTPPTPSERVTGAFVTNRDGGDRA